MSTGMKTARWTPNKATESHVFIPLDDRNTVCHVLKALESNMALHAAVSATGSKKAEDLFPADGTVKVTLTFEGSSFTRTLDAATARKLAGSEVISTGERTFLIPGNVVEPDRTSFQVWFDSDDNPSTAALLPLVGFKALTACQRPRGAKAKS